GDGEHGRQEDDHLGQAVENGGAACRVVGADVVQEGTQAVVGVGEVVDVHEQVNDDVQTEQADQADDVRLDVAVDQEPVEHPNHRAGLPAFSPLSPKGRGENLAATGYFCLAVVGDLRCPA